MVIEMVYQYHGGFNFIGLMGILEKRRFRNFLIFCSDYDVADPKTHKGM